MEEKDVYDLIGSQIRDTYRALHKKRECYSSDAAWKSCYGLDIDFVEMRNGRIVAFIDVKSDFDKITATEEQAYEQLRAIAPVFIVTVLDAYFKSFRVESFPDKKYSRTYYSREAFFQQFIEPIKSIIERERIS